MEARLFGLLSVESRASGLEFQNPQQAKVAEPLRDRQLLGRVARNPDSQVVQDAHVAVAQGFVEYQRYSECLLLLLDEGHPGRQEELQPRSAG